jgi:transcriptional regulator GlxA family with amidase domain
MSKQEAETDNGVETDEHGLQIHKYLSMVLVVVPSYQYGEATLRYARSALFNVNVGTRSVATLETELIHGELQDEFQVDGPISGESMDAYSGLIVCGGAGSAELEESEDVLRLVREAAAADKLIGAWGRSIGTLAKAGVLKGRRVTGERSQAEAVKAAGGRFTGTQVQVDGKIVTASDDAAGFRFAKRLVGLVEI